MIPDRMSPGPGRPFDGIWNFGRAAPTPVSIGDGGFVTLMRNDARLSRIDEPGIAVAPGGLGLLRVELRGALLIISEVGATRSDTNSDVIHLIEGARVALRTIPREGCSVFSFLAVLPDGLALDGFIPAFGAVTLFDDKGGKRALSGSGFDIGGRSGWIYNACGA